MIDTFHDRHYTLKEVAGHLNVSASTALRLIKAEPGVIHIQLGKKRKLTTYSVPETVLRRIYNRMVA